MSLSLGAGSMVGAQPRSRRRRAGSSYPTWFYLPAAIIFGVLFMLPTFASLFFSLTRWTLFEAQFIGLANFVQFFREPFLVQGLINTLIYGVVTSGMKVVLGMLLLGGYLAVADYSMAIQWFWLISMLLLGYTHRREWRRFFARFVHPRTPPL